MQGLRLKTRQNISAQTTAASPRHPCEDCTVRHRAVCSALDDAELSRLNEVVMQVRIEAGRTLFYEQDRADFTFNVTRGVVRLSKMLPDGRRQVTGFLFGGDFLGLAFRRTYAYTAEAITDVALCRFPVARMSQIFEEFPKLEQRLLEIACNELVLAQDQMLLLGRKTAAERLASFLLMLQHRAVERGDAHEPLLLQMGRTDISDYLGLTIETISRTFARLKEIGAITLPTPSKVMFVRPDLLLQIADGEAVV
jgi:CRP/FNR family transcriptional regulator, anaerobic regulatory protein